MRAELAAAVSGVEAGRGALAKLRKDHEGERERVKKVMGDLKKKMDRCEIWHIYRCKEWRDQYIRNCIDLFAQPRARSDRDLVL